jgi:hypothetical protein
MKEKFTPRRGLLCLLLLLCHSILFAQPFLIKGKVQDTQQNPILGNALLLSADEKQLLRGEFINAGLFELKADTAGKYTLKISALGYTERSIPLHITAQQREYNLGEIELATATAELQEVSITAHKSLFEKTADGTRFNIENTLLSKSVNALEILTKSPGISIASGKVNVFGRGEAMIVLNGREIALETFKSLPPGEIKSLEIITNPSAKYDAKGKALILVSMKKTYQQGLLATLSEAVTLGFYPQNNANLNLSLKQKDLSLSAFYANEWGSNWNNNQYSTFIDAAAGQYRTFSEYEERARSKDAHTYRLGLGYALSEKSDLSVQYDGLYNYFKLDVRQDGDFYSPRNALTQIRMRNDASTRLINHSGNVNYHRRLDTLGSTFFMGVQYNRFENQLLDQIRESITTPEQVQSVSQRINDSNNLIHLFIAQADWSKALANGSKLEMGFKYSQISNEGRIRFLSKPLENPTYVESPQYANGTRYEESIPAAYVLWSGTKNRWSYNLGLRAEHTIAEGFSKKLNRNIIDTTYLKFFPSAKLSRQFNDNWSSALTFARKINRPLYQDLDPFLWYLDSLTSIQGNPRLVPETLHQLEWAFSYKSYTLKMAYTHSDHTIWAITKPGLGGSNSVVYIKDNIQQRQLYSLSLELPFGNDHYNTFNILSYNLSRFSDSRPEYRVRPASPQFYLYTYHQFILPKLFNIDLSGEYYGANADGFARRKPYYYLTFGVSRSFLHKKLNTQLMFNDFLRTARFQGNRVIGTVTNDYNQRINTHYLRLTLTYQYGGVKDFKYKNKAINEKEFGRIKQ